MWLGVDNPPRWTASKDTAIIAVAIMNIWRSVGYYMVLFIAGLHLSRRPYTTRGSSTGEYRSALLAHYATHVEPHDLFRSDHQYHQLVPAFTSIYVMTGGGPARRRRFSCSGYTGGLRQHQLRLRLSPSDDPVFDCPGFHRIPIQSRERHVVYIA
jgi:hypothetical protein